VSVIISQDIRRSSAVSTTPERSARTTSATQAPALVQPQGQGIVVSADVLAELDAGQSRRTNYDQPDQKQQRAILAYQQTARHSQREQLQQLFSVDLYA